MQKIVGAILLFLAAAFVASADTVTLKNGDHITGTFVKADGKTVSFKSDAAGDLSIDWGKISELTTEKSIYVVMPDKKVIGGPATVQGTDLVITTTASGAVHVPIASLTVVRSQSEEDAYEHLQHLSLLEDWNLGANVGFALARGNSNTTNLSIGFTSVRETPKDKISAYATSIYAQSTVAGVSSVTADDVRGGALYNHNLTHLIFAFGSVDYEYNSPQELDLRSIYSGGVGWNVIKKDTTTFDVMLGANYTREAYSTGLDRNIAAITAGETLMHKFGKSTVLTQQMLFYPNISDAGQYRLAYDMAIATKINKWFAWQTTASDRYLSDPIPGTKSNDLILTTGLSVTITHPTAK